MSIPLIQYVGKRTKVTDPKTGKKSPKGSLFTCRKDPEFYPDVKTINERLTISMIRHPNVSPLDSIAVNMDEILYAAALSEPWAKWLDDQQDNHNGGKWHIDHTKGENNLPMYDIRMLTSETVDIVIENDATAQLFKLAMQGM